MPSLAYQRFVAALTDVCIDLAKQVAGDGEGATRLIEICVSGAQDEAQAHIVGDSIARSPLFKCAVHGGDPNWGRVLCAAGYSGAAIDPDRLSLSFGAPAGRFSLDRVFGIRVPRVLVVMVAVAEAIMVVLGIMSRPAPASPTEEEAGAKSEGGQKAGTL